ncbi:MAG: hypothetical protein ACK5PS_07550 [Desulfopila sp.]
MIESARRALRASPCKTTKNVTFSPISTRKSAEDPEQILAARILATGLIAMEEAAGRTGAQSLPARPADQQGLEILTRSGENFIIDLSCQPLPVPGLHPIVFTSGRSRPLCQERVGRTQASRAICRQHGWTR